MELVQKPTVVRKNDYAPLTDLLKKTETSCPRIMIPLSDHEQPSQQEPVGNINLLKQEERVSLVYHNWRGDSLNSMIWVISTDAKGHILANGHTPSDEPHFVGFPTCMTLLRTELAKKNQDS